LNSKTLLDKIEQMIAEGNSLGMEMAETLLSEEIALEPLLELANRVRREYSGNEMALCSIVNGKSGKCSEDCKFCAQSIHYDTGVETYNRLSVEEILESAREMEREGVRRFSIVTSGRDLTDEDLEWLEPIYKTLKQETNMDICASHGMLSESQAVRLKRAGVTTYHHNLETSRRHYEAICTTHAYEERIETIEACQRAGLRVCSGGIFGIDETEKDRLEMAFELRTLGVDSVPVNFLMPIKGTPMALNTLPSAESILRMLAIYRLILPSAEIRYAGGRALLGTRAKDGFCGGVNGALSGNYLTTVGNSVAQDKAMVTELGFKLV